MRNLEFKTRCADLTRGEQIATAIGASFGGDLHQVDTYFVVSNGRLKLREFLPLPHGAAAAGAELISYDRPEDTATRWSDYFTSPVPDAASMRDVLTRALGVRQVIEKVRRLYLYRGARIHLDRVTRLGAFVEFEVPTTPPPAFAGDAGEKSQAHATMRELMQAFGLNDADAIQASYSELLQKAPR